MSFMEKVAHLRIPLEDIIQATNNFAPENFVEKDGIAIIYKGELAQPEGFVTVAVSRFDKEDVQGSKEFLEELMFVSGYRHENIVSLVGVCDEGHEMILVHEFPTHGSLDKYLSSANLTWLNRLQICLDAARGLNYLHNPSQPHMGVLHRDMKSANILLDKIWHAKISIGSLISISQSSLPDNFLVTDAAGTFGYLDPVYYNTGVLTTESDIYSFGMVLMESLCGRLAYEEGSEFLGPLATRKYKEGKLSKIIDPNLRKQMSPDSLDVFSALAYQCLKDSRKERPTTVEVVEKLEEVLGLQQKFEEALSHQQVADNLKDKREGEDDFKEKNVQYSLRDKE